MRSLTVLPWILAGAIGAGPFAPPPPATDSALSALEARGKRIFVSGQSLSGAPIQAVLGEAGVEVPASALPCAGCHGRDGRGRPEGGVTPSDITWTALTKSYGVRHESGREHPPYTPRTLKKAISLGVDPAGQKLHGAMPRYRMALEDMGALVAYLQKLGTERDPGVGEQVLRLGTLVPGDGPAAAAGAAVAQLLTAFVARVNQNGGLYGRQLELVVGRLPGDPAQRVEAAARFLEQEPVFALVSPMVAGTDREIEALLEEREIPSVGPLTLHPRDRFPLPRYTFYLYSGFLTQGRVLLEVAAEGAAGTSREGPPRLVLLVPEDPLFLAAAVDLRTRAEERFMVLERRLPAGPLNPSAAAALAAELARPGIDAVLTLHPVGLDPVFLRALAAAGARPRVLAAGVLAGPELFALPPELRERVTLAFPTIPADQTPRGASRYAELQGAAGLPREHGPTQLAALAAAEILVEGLERAGRRLSRVGLVEALEGLYDYRTELAPPVTFSANRRIGALGAYVVSLAPDGPGLRPQGGFRTPR